MRMEPSIQPLLDPASYPSKGNSGTGFYAYAFTWGIRHELIPYEEIFSGCE